MTAEILEEFASEVQDGRDRVEFRSDGSYALLSDRREKKRHKVTEHTDDRKTNMDSGDSVGSDAIDRLLDEIDLPMTPLISAGTDDP